MTDLELFQTETLAFLDGVVRNISEAITVVDEQGRCLFANRLAAEMCGYDTVDEFLRADSGAILSRFEMVDESGARLEVTDLPGREVFQDDNESAVAVVKYRSKDEGQFRWTRIRASRFPHPVTKSRLAVNLFQDVTDEVRAAQKREFLLEASKVLAGVVDYENRLKKIAQLCVPTFADWCGIHMLGDDGFAHRVTVAHSDPAMVGLAQQLSARTPYDPDSKHGVALVIRTGEPEVIEDISPELIQSLVSDRELARDLSGLGIRSSMCIPLRARGKTLGAMTLIAAESGRTFSSEDVDFVSDFATLASTELDNARLYREAQRSFAQLEAVVSQMGDPVIFAGPDGKVVFVNQAAFKVFGAVKVGDTWRAGDSQPESEDGTPIDPDRLPLNRASRGESVSGFRWRVRSKGGQIVELESAAVQVVGEGGQPSGAVAVDRDVTEQVRLRRQKELFLLSATHDLKNPLTEVKGRAQLLRNIVQRSQPTDDRVISGLSRIDQAADRVVRRLEELLDASRTEMGVLPSNDVHEVELGALFERVAERVSPMATQHEIQVLDETARVRGWWDAPRIERALYNILANAVKYSPDGGKITVRLWTERREGTDCACVSITDTGLGIPAADLPFIFDAFHRGQNVDEGVEGSGIGLAGVKQILEQIGGWLEVESQEGAGSTFTATLPLDSRLRNDEE